MLDAQRLEIEQRIALPGRYSVHAVAPDGDTLYLLHHRKGNANKPAAYEVVAHDRSAGTRTALGRLSGRAFGRLTSVDGRWEFTLYDHPDQPFLQALNLAARTAESIALPQLRGEDLASAKLTLDGGTVAIGRLATVDPDTRVVALTAPRPGRQERAPPWPIVAGELVMLAIVTLLVVRRRRRTVDEEDELFVSVREPPVQGPIRGRAS